MSDAAAQETGPPSKAKVFLSYSRKDIAFVDQLDAALKARGFSLVGGPDGTKQVFSSLKLQFQ